MSAPTRTKARKRPRMEHDALARAYYEASKAGADMFGAVNALETIRDAVVPDGMSLAAWDEMDRQIGIAQDGALRDVLMDTRSSLVEHFTGSEIARLSQALRRDPERGWELWIRSFADALALWRFDLCLSLATPDMPFPDSVTTVVANLAAGARKAMRREWIESFDTYVYVAQAELVDKHTRALLCVVAAEIYMYWFNDFDRTKEWLERGHELHAEAGRVASTWGAYWLQREDTEAAKKQLEHALDLDPGNTDACVSMGEIHQRAGNLDAAEEWYLRATEVDPGNADGYRSLIDIYGNPDRFEEGEQKLAPLYDTIAAVSPLSAYDACVDLSRAYQQNGSWETAVACAERGIGHDPTRPEAYGAKGDVLAGAGRIDEAERIYREGVEMAGESFDAHWSLAWFYHQQQRWTDALAAFETSLSLRPAWEDKVRAAMGEVRMKLGQTEDAEKDLFRVLEISPDDSSATDTLEDLANLYLERDGALAGPLRIYDRMLELKGKEYRGTYENLKANSYYYTGDNRTAATHYERAVAAKPESSVLHANLAGALEKLAIETDDREVLDRAVAEFERALELDSASSSDRERLAGLRLQQRLFDDYGGRVLALAPHVVPVYLEVGDALAAFVSPDGQSLSDEIQTLVEDMNQRISSRYGVEAPNVRFRMLGADQTDIDYAILINEAVVATDSLSENRFVPASPDDLRGKGIFGWMGDDPLTNRPGSWIDADDAAEARSVGFEVWEPLVYPMRHLEAIVRANLHELIGHDDVVEIVGRDIDAELDVNEPEALTHLTTLVRGLLAEDVPPARLALAGVTAMDDPATAVESLRSAEQIRAALPTNGSRSRTPLDPSVQQRLGRHVAGRVSLVPLPREEAEGLIQAIEGGREELGDVVVVEEGGLRPFVKALLDVIPVRAAVISESELAEASGPTGVRSTTGDGDGADQS